MKTIGLLGGMSWESTVPYYRRGRSQLAHRIIYDELCLGSVLDASRAHYLRIMAGLVAGDTQAVILGCTEIGLLVDAADCSVPLFDTTAIHANAAAEYAFA